MLLSIKNLCKKFGDKILYKNLNLELKPQQITVLLGLNGTGKSTLVRCIMREQPVEEGQIIINSQIAVLPTQNHLIEDQSIHTNFENYYFLLNQPFSVKALNDYLNSQKLNPTDLIKTCSYGTKRKLAVKRVLLEPNNLIILDEPALGADFSTVANLAALLKQEAKKNKAFLVISHDYPLAKIAHQLVLLSEVQYVLNRHSNGYFFFVKTEPYCIEKSLESILIEDIDVVFKDNPNGNLCLKLNDESSYGRVFDKLKQNNYNHFSVYYKKARSLETFVQKFYQVASESEIFS